MFFLEQKKHLWYNVIQSIERVFCLPRFFVDKNQITDTAAYIEGEDVNHIRRVLRLREGDMIAAFPRSRRTEFRRRLFHPVKTARNQKYT